MPGPTKNINCSCSSSSSGGPGASRREFLELLGATAAASWLSAGPAVAGPFEAKDFEKLVPADKRLSPEWVRSLTARGEPTVYRGLELEKIGMPVGGICAGQLYLGGDGKLWHWDIFNRHVGTGAEHYARPLSPASPLDQGFALLVSSGDQVQVRALDRTGWSDISFCGQYPIGRVDYRDPQCPASVSLEAFSPFVPLSTEDSSLPATVMQFTVKNGSSAKIEAELAGWLENAVCLHSAPVQSGLRRNRVVRGKLLTFLECSAEPPPPVEQPEARPDIAFEDFEKETYEGWQATGTAFGSGPIEKAKMPAYQGDVGSQGRRLVNTHNTRQGEEVGGGDAHVGTLTSRAFVIERNYLNFLIGGGAHAGRTCMNLLVEDKVVATATGANDNRMQAKSWDVRRWAGQTARLQIVDDERGGWGNVGVDEIVLSDKPRVAAGPLQDEADFGTMGLALLEPQPGDVATTSLADSQLPQGIFTRSPAGSDAPAVKPFGQKLAGSLTRKLSLEPGQSATVTLVVTWHFPNLKINEKFELTGRYYAQRFPSALAVAEHVAANFDTLCQQTRLWHDTWYDSTLPHWFLDRTFANTSILATSTCFRLANGRFWGWEGVGCCPGTCGHVWHYAQAVGRLFPELERILRERVDFGLAQREDGAILFRGEFNNFPAVDGQAGAILRAYREHQMSADGAFLRRVWPGVKRALEYLIREDANGDGLIEGKQHNTLDADWYGPVAWLSSLYLAALRAGEEMARETGEAAFADQCRQIFEKGREAIVAQLFDGDYFVNRADPQHPEAINSGTGCHIDQVFGQSWAYQVALGRVLPEKETQAALRSLWRYNFTPDVGPYREANKPGRWYAMPGEGGLLMCTFPRADWNYDKAKGKGADWAAGYFNECMNGFEYQVAGHMIWEGLLTEGLAITRMVHDRYHAARRNPWNEVECGDHYARSMASYGVFLAACGYEHHGPQGHLSFAPRLTPDDFRAAFTTAEGWGTFTQKREGGKQTDTIEVKSGRLRLNSVEFALPENTRPTQSTVTAAGKSLTVTVELKAGRARIAFAAPAVLAAGQTLQVEMS